MFIIAIEPKGLIHISSPAKGFICFYVTILLVLEMLRSYFGIVLCLCSFPSYLLELSSVLGELETFAVTIGKSNFLVGYQSTSNIIVLFELCIDLFC